MLWVLKWDICDNIRCKELHNTVLILIHRPHLDTALPRSAYLRLMKMCLQQSWLDPQSVYAVLRGVTECLGWGIAFCPAWVLRVGLGRGRKWALELKSPADDNVTVLGRNILVQINSVIHLIRLPWSMTHSFEWIQVIILELLPWNGNAPLGTKSTH